jgi:excisionase family DNA binding protein
VLTPKQAAAGLGITTETLRRWTRTGRINAYLTPGGHRRYLEEDVARVLDVAAVAEATHLGTASTTVHALQELHDLPAWSTEESPAREGQTETCFRFRLTIADASSEERLKHGLGLASTRAAGYRAGGALYSADFECEGVTFSEALARIVGAVENTGRLRVLEIRRLGEAE